MIGLLDLIDDVADDAEHIIAATDIIAESTLESRLVVIKVFELTDTELAEFVDGIMCGGTVEVQSEQYHVLRSEEVAGGRGGRADAIDVDP